VRRILLALIAAAAVTTPSLAAKFEIARIYIEYNSSANDLGFHVSLDGEDWRSLKIVNPAGVTIFDVAGRAAYAELGLTELFFEGAEPSLDDFPLGQLLSRFPEGTYRFIGQTVSGRSISATGRLSHAVPEGPDVSADVDDDAVVIRWSHVGATPPGFPRKRIQITGYQVLVDPLEVTLPASADHLTLPAEFVESLAPGAHPFEVLAIDASGNQTITEGEFVTD
jgi:hypothetical protein